MNFIARSVHTTARRAFHITPSLPSTTSHHFYPTLTPNFRPPTYQFTPLPQYRLSPLPLSSQQHPPQHQQFGSNPYFQEVLEFMNRNKRKPKKANHGARPCSSVSRSKKKLRRHHYPK